MKILLISPNTLTAPYPVYPIGLDYVVGAMSAAEHILQRADLNVLSQQEFFDLLAAFQPDIIGISCRNLDNTDISAPASFISGYADLVSQIRGRSQAIIVLGGSGFNIMPEELLATAGADYGLIGEGERFAELVQALAEGQSALKIPGVIQCGVKTGQLPPAQWSGPYKRILAPPNQLAFYLQRGGMLNLQSKRGCPFRCVYCSYPAIEGKKHRLFDPDEVAATALSLESAGAKYLFFTDSAFNSDIKHSLAVAQACKRAGLRLPWGAFFAPVPLPADYFAQLADAGLTHVEFGTESMSPPVLQAYRKPFTVQDVLTAHAQAQAAGLHVAHYFLLGGPGENTTTINETLTHIEQLPKSAFFFFMGMRIYPQTGLYDIALQEGCIKPATNLLEPVYYHQPATPEKRVIEAMVQKKADNRINWLIGSGEAQVADIITKMHSRGFVGPLWEFLVR